jgi:hypothetical protein
MAKVFIDESGNSGQNLLDQADPVFVLASCSFGGDAESKVLSHFAQFQGPELKYSRLRKSAPGQQAVLSFLRSDEFTSETAAAVIFHKPFMVVTKYCDLVLEPHFRNAGRDFYARGLNIATANLLSTTMPVILNPSTWLSFLSLFVRSVRERTPSLFNEWRKLGEIIYSYLEHEHPSAAHLFASVLSISSADAFYLSLTSDELDPIIPSYPVIVNHWGKSLIEPFDVVADASRVLSKSRDRLLALSAHGLKPVSAGYDRRKIDYPLKVSDIVFVNSLSFRQVQIADIIGGALAAAAKALVKGPLRPGTYAYEILHLCNSKGIVVDMLWPSNEIDPKGLGTDVAPNAEDVSLADYTGKVLAGDPATKNDAKVG